MRQPVNRLRATLACAATVAVAGAVLHWASSETPYLTPDPGSASGVTVQSAVTEPKADSSHELIRDEIAQRFMQGVTMLHAREYEHATTAFHRALELAPKLPEAHVNMGFAMLGLSRYSVARDFFRGAIELRPSQRNAYYGLAAAYDGMGQKQPAIEAMRVYVYLSPRDDPFVRKANAALWEWSSGTTNDSAQQPRALLPPG